MVGVKTHQPPMEYTTDFDINSTYPYTFVVANVVDKSIKILGAATVDDEQWYTVHIRNHYQLIRFLLDKEKEKSAKVVYIDSPSGGGVIYDMNEELYTFICLKFGE